MHRALVLLLSALPSAVLTAQRIAEVEPNDSAAQAQPLTLGVHVDANLAAGTQDWYSFTLTATSQVHVQTCGNFAVSSSVDTAVFVYDAAGTVLQAWDDGARSSHSDCGVTLPAGTYTAMVIGKLGTTAGDYGLDLFAYAAAPIQVAEAAEPNNSPSLGGFPTPIALGDTFGGALSAPTDEDWYSFTLAVPTIVQAAVMDDGGAPQLDSTLVGLQQESSPGVWVAVGTTSTLATSHRAFNMGHTAALAPGNYAIRVTSGTATSGTAPITYVKTGNYAVRTRALPFAPAATATESVEPNNTLSTATFMSLGDDATGNSGGSLDPDWYAVNVTGPTLIAAMTENGSAPSVTDTTITLRDAAGNLVASATSGGPTGTSHAKLVATVNVAGIYFIEVTGGVLAATGNYVLHTSATSPMFVSATFQQQPPSTNACPGSTGLRPALNRANGEVPQIGSHFVLRVNNALPNTFLISGLGFSNTTAAGGTVPLPLELLVFGAPGCFLRVDPELQGFGLSDGAGLWFWDLPVPNNPAIAGVTAYAQVLLVDAGNPGGISVTNDVRLVVGDRGF